jgi:hypothetical protein
MALAVIELAEPWAERRRHVVLRSARGRPRYLSDLVEAICAHEQA